MIVRVLGSAAGGGVPQWNCNCFNCAAARAGRQPVRSQSSIALSADGEHWVLVNISPDVAQQIQNTPALWPRHLRHTPIEVGLFTDANIDHIGGLSVLRQAHERGFTFWSNEFARRIAQKQPAFAPFTKAPHSWRVMPAMAWTDIGTGLQAMAVPTPGTTPGYAGRRETDDAVFSYILRERNRGPTILMAPVFRELNEALQRAIEKSTVAFLDGSFWTDDELPRLGLGSKTARSLGHQPLSGWGGTLEKIAPYAVRTRCFATHINNSNPILDASSQAHQTVRDAGCEIAFDGLELVL